MLIKIDEKSQEIDRPRFRLWLTIEKLRDRLLTAVDKSDIEAFCDAIFSVLSTVGLEDVNEDAPWYEIAGAFLEVINASSPKVEMPFLSYPGDKNIPAWDYEGRDWFEWAVLIAQETGWTLEYIANLEIEDALAIIQEILVSRQFKREWEWERSQWAYSFNQRTNSSEHHEIPRPDWMRKGLRREAPKTVQIRKSMIPVGNVIRYDPNTGTKSTESS